MASMKLPTIKGLQQKVEAAKQAQYIVDGALEAENLTISTKSKAVKENHAKIAMWGEISNGEMKNIWFKNEGDFVEIKLTEQFEKSKIQICAAVGKNCGTYDIYINDKLQASQDLYSNHGGVTNSYINLGENEPVDNVFILKFVFKGTNLNAQRVKGKAALGIDFFLVDNNFLNR